jgi:hypothetical protein
MSALVNSDGLRTAGYLMAATLALVAGFNDMRSRGRDAGWWPTVWFVSATILLALAMARAVDLGHLVPDLGRRRARSEGWYAQRRDVQEMGIAVIAVVLAIAVVGAIIWLRSARRRYLPEVVAVLALLAFAGVRLVSLHQVDVLLYRRRIEGIKLDVVVELAILAVAIVVPLRDATRWWARRPLNAR